MKYKILYQLIFIFSLLTASPVYVFAQNKDTVPDVNYYADPGGQIKILEFEPAPGQKDIILKGRCEIAYPDMNTDPSMPGVCVALVCITDQTRQYAKTDSEGLYQFTLLPAKKYYFTAHKKGFGNSLRKDTISTMSLTKPVTLWRDIYFENFDYFIAGSFIPIGYANRNATGLDSNAGKILEGAINMLKEYPYRTLEIASHTNCRGTNRQCDSISLLRALIVKQYMVSRGVDSSRLIARGYGKRTTSKCGCTPYKRHNKRECTKAQNMANNCTAFILLNKDFAPNDGEVFECDEK